MRRLLTALLAAALLAAACGDDSEDPTTTDTTAATTTAAGGDDGSGDDNDDSSTTTAAEPTTTTTEPATTTAPPPAVTADDLAATGPYPVGVTRRELPTGNLAEIWYPAGPEAEGATDTYRVRAFLPSIMADLVPEDTDDSLTVAAGRDAAPADGETFPLVLFSHGSTSFRFQSTTLAHHLASWGMVVASADHPSRYLGNLLGGPEDPQPASDDARALRELVVADATLGPAIDAELVAVSGHSAGGGTTLQIAGDDGIDGYVSYASGAFDDATLPELPSMFMAGAIDTIVEPSRTRAAFDAAPAPSWYLEFAEAGHLVFSDLCFIGGGNATLIDLARDAGLGDFIDERLERLGTDGCQSPNRPVEEVWPGIHQATTGFLRWVFGIDAEPIGVDAPAVTGVTVDSK